MDEQLIRQLTRQLKLLNFWITFFGVLFLVAFIIIGVLIYKVVTFTQDTADKINDLQTKTQQTLDVQKKICDSDTISSLLNKKTGVCD